MTARPGAKKNAARVWPSRVVRCTPARAGNRRSSSMVFPPGSSGAREIVDACYVMKLVTSSTAV